MSAPLSLPSPTANCTKPPSSSPFPSPRLFVGLTTMGFSNPEAAMSPTSILETKPFSAIMNPFSDRNPRKPPPWDNGDSKPIGLGIVEALNNDKPGKKSSKPDCRMVLFGSQLKIQIPSPIRPEESPHSPIEFGVKNKNSQLALLSPAQKSPMGSANLGSDGLGSFPRVFTGCLSASEMELSEDYTCVIAHGPNPRTTHIFDNCIVESCGDGLTASRKENRFWADRSSGDPLDDFLNFCHACKKNLVQGKDIFMYRGEKAFCSHECRYQDMLLDEEGMEECPPDP